MVISGDSLYKWRSYKFPTGMKVNSQEEFEAMITSRAEAAEIACEITHDSLSIGNLTALVGFSGGECMRISPTKRKKEKKGLLKTVTQQAFSNLHGDFVITFTKQGVYEFMDVYKCTQMGILNAFDGDSAAKEPFRDTWAVIMEDIIENVAKACM